MFMMVVGKMIIIIIKITRGREGAFNNYVDQILPNLYPTPPRVDKIGRFSYFLPFVMWPQYKDKAVMICTYWYTWSAARCASSEWLTAKRCGTVHHRQQVAKSIVRVHVTHCGLSIDPTNPSSCPRSYWMTPRGGKRFAGNWREGH